MKCDIQTDTGGTAVDYEVTVIMSDRRRLRRGIDPAVKIRRGQCPYRLHTHTIRRRHSTLTSEIARDGGRYAVPGRSRPLTL